MKAGPRLRHEISFNLNISRSEIGQSYIDIHEYEFRVENEDEKTQL